MVQRKMLLDTNSYLRLARNIHPLLLREFGAEKHCLYVLAELERELNASTRLEHKFHWAQEAAYKQNRLAIPTISRKQKREIENAQGIIWDHVQTDCPGPSRVDVVHLATAFVLAIPLVTDDGAMRLAAATFEIETLMSLDLLRKMVDCSHIDRAKVREIVAYWKYWKDEPAALKDTYAHRPRSGQLSGDRARKLRKPGPSCEASD